MVQTRTKIVTVTKMLGLPRVFLFIFNLPRALDCALLIKTSFYHSDGVKYHAIVVPVKAV